MSQTSVTRHLEGPPQCTLIRQAFKQQHSADYCMQLRSHHTISPEGVSSCVFPLCCPGGKAGDPIPGQYIILFDTAKVSTVSDGVAEYVYALDQQ